MKTRIAFAMFLSAAVAACGETSAPTASSDATAAKVEAESLTLPEGVLSEKHLLAYLRAKMAFQRADEFSKDFDDGPLVGRRFKITVPYNPTTKDNLTYSYDAAKEVLSLSVWPEVARHEVFEPYKIILKDDRDYLKPVPMSNAFGVTKDVTPIIERRLVIGAKASELGVFPRTLSSGVIDPLERKLPMPPDKTRDAVKGLALELEGTVTATDGKAIECQSGKEQATLTYNYETDWRDCVLAVKLSGVRITSPSAGVLAEWH